MTNIKELLGSNVKAYRSKLGISQAKLAEMINMATNYLGLIEGGKKFPSADMIERDSRRFRQRLIRLIHNHTHS